jgi:hypothetical protein
MYNVEDYWDGEKMSLMKLNPLLYSLIFFVVLVSVGCSVPKVAPDNPISSDNNLTPTMTSTVAATIMPRETFTPQVQLPEKSSTPVVTPDTPSPSTVQPTATVAPSATPTIPTIELSEPLFVCTEPALEFNAQEAFGFFTVSNLRFVDEQTITFEGWAIRPAPTNQSSMVNSVLASPLSFQSSSARLLFKAGTVDLNSGEVFSRTLDFLLPFSNPCSGECPHEVIAQSPDQDWQLIQVSDWRETEIGIWLVENSGFTTRIVSYVPPFSTWQWAEDSSMLWFDHSVIEYGSKALVVNLESTPVTQTVISETDNRFDPTYYSLAFSPLDKTVLSTPHEPIFTNSDELYKLRLESEMAIVSTTIVPDIQAVTWNEASRRYLLTIMRGNELDMLDEGGETLLQVPASVFEAMFPSLSDYNILLNELFGASSSLSENPVSNYK